MLKTLRKQSGFSLVELMVVVAIIGILAAIAVPNFQKFTAKSKQSEAKSNLSALYSSERAFQAEWQVYDSWFQAVGYQPVGTLRYQHGFSADNHHTTMSGYTGPTQGNSSTFSYCAQGGNNPTNNCIVTIVPLNPTNVTGATVVDGGATGPTFTAMAKGDIDGDSAFDTWTINESKTLVNTVPDLEQ